MDDILHASIAQLAAQIRKGKISPVELIEMTLQAIDQCEPALERFHHRVSGGKPRKG